MTTDKKTVLVIYELVPEETYFYKLSLAENEPLMKDLRTVHGKYMNIAGYTDEEEAALERVQAVREDLKYLKAEDGPFVGPFDLVIHTGFIL